MVFIDVYARLKSSLSPARCFRFDSD